MADTIVVQGFTLPKFTPKPATMYKLRDCAHCGTSMSLPNQHLAYGVCTNCGKLVRQIGKD